MTAYTLALTDEDVRTIAFIGDRYAWSNALRVLEAGENQIAEREAWRIVEAFANDTGGGHSPFPMLDPRSPLYERLIAFWTSVV